MLEKIPWEGWSALAALIAAVAATAAVVANIWTARRSDRSVRAKIRSRFARSIDPAGYVGAYNVRTQAYLPISSDDEIAAALAEGSDILLLGRGGIGKSHAAVKHIIEFSKKRWHQRWRVLTLDRVGSIEFSKDLVKRRNYILFLDDINEYAATADGNIFSIIDSARHFAKRIQVVATLRSSAPALEAMASGSKLFSRFRSFDLEDWSNNQRDQLVALTGVSIEQWDGTPLSAKQPSDELRQIYKQLPDIERYILRMAKCADAFGLHYCPRDVLLAATQNAWPVVDPGQFSAAIDVINGHGFLKLADDKIQIYAPYLPFIDTIQTEKLTDSLCKSLLDGAFDEQLRVVGHGAYARGEYNTALALLEKFVSRQPESPNGHYRLAMTLVRLNRPEAAVEEFKIAADLLPTYYSALYQLAKVYERLGKTELAAGAFHSARAAQTAETPAQLIALAELHRVSDQPQAALELISQCLDKDPDIRHGWGLKGRILLQLDQLEEATLAFEEAVKRDPDAFVFFGLGQAARGLGEWDKAIASFQASAALLPTAGQTYSLLGQSLHKAHRLVESIEAFETAIELGYQPAHFGLGLVLKRKKDWAGAEKHFRAAIESDPNLAVGFSYLGTALEWLGRRDEALTVFERSIALQPRNKYHRFAYGEALARAKRIDDAVKVYKSALKIDPNFKMASDKLARLLTLTPSKLGRS
jgi:tetratricopeptide (TPR) repeat protein